MHSPAPCLFLEAFPPELRLMVYEYLLVCSQPLATNDCAEPLPSGRRLDSGILAANRQIHDEAAAVLYGKNTFCVGPRRGGEGGIVAVARRYRHLVRSLRVEVLYCAGETVKTNEEEEEECPEVESSDEGVDPVEERCKKQDHDAKTYVSSLVPILSQSKNLTSLALTVTPPPYPSKRIIAALLPLTSCSTASTSSLLSSSSLSFPDVFHSLSLTTPPVLHFDFKDCFHYSSFSSHLLQSNGVLLLACKVLFWKSHLRVERAVREAEGEIFENSKGRVDLGALVGEGVEKLMERGREVVGWGM